MGLEPKPLPIGGASNNRPFAQERADRAPVERLCNVRVFDADTDRPRLGSRPGFELALRQTLGVGPVQGQTVVSRASVIDGYTVTDCVGMTGGQTEDGGPIVGNLYQLDDVPSLIESIDVAPGAGDTPTDAADAIRSIAFSPDGTLIAAAIAVTFTTGAYAGFTGWRLSVFSATTGALLKQTAPFGEAGRHRTVSTMEWTDYGIMVITDEFVVPVGYEPLTNVFFTGVGEAALGFFTLGYWGSVCTGTALRFIAGATEQDAPTIKFYACFDGPRNSNHVVNDAGGYDIDAGDPGAQFRAGIIAYNATVSWPSPWVPGQTAGVTAWTQEAFGATLATSDTYFAGAHQYFRYGEKSALKPRGASITCKAPAMSRG